MIEKRSKEVFLVLRNIIASNNTTDYTYKATFTYHAVEVINDFLEQEKPLIEKDIIAEVKLRIFN